MMVYGGFSTLWRGMIPVRCDMIAALFDEMSVVGFKRRAKLL
jgi:hypothetical protein